MATLDQVEQALIRADQAGDAEGARILAAEVRRLRAGTHPSATDNGGQRNSPITGNRPLTMAPQDDVSLSDRLSNFASGAKAAMYAPIVGIAQRLGLPNAESAAAGWRDAASEAASRPGGMGGLVVGGAIPGIPLSLVPGANTIIGGGLLGAATGAMQPTSPGESASANALTGAVAGAAVPAAIRAVKVAKSALIDPFTDAGTTRIAGNALNNAAGIDFIGGPLTTRVAGALSDFATNAKQARIADVASRLQNARGITPGFVPTTAQASDNAGISALDRTMSALFPGTYEPALKQQRTALADALRSIAQNPEARAAAIEARNQAVEPLYDAAKSAKVQGDTVLDALMRRPSMTQATARAVKLANERGEQFALPKATPAGEVSTGILDANGNPITNQVPYSPAVFQGKTLHDIKMGLDDAIGTPALGMQGAERDAALGTKGEFMNWLEQKIPEYQQARTTYAEMSRPANQMDIGQALYNKLVPALAEVPVGQDPYNITASNYATALRNGDELAKSVTGLKNATMNSIMTPEQMQTLEGVRQDAMMRAAAVANGRGSGSDTVQKLSMSNLANSAGIPTFVADLASVPGGWIKRAGDLLYKSADEAARQKLAFLLTNPQEAAKAMISAGASPSMLSRVLQTGGQSLSLGAIPSYLTLTGE